ncbi:MAG: hypothetical protein N3G75_07685 [Methanothrix sp.]|nr:hypothetical protein [Methanothrix sp.]MCX8207695.1 hypothetical protein [Methanothrix sp.]
MHREKVSSRSIRNRMGLDHVSEYHADDAVHVTEQDELQAAIERGKSLVDDWIELKQLGERAERYC